MKNTLLFVVVFVFGAGFVSAQTDPPEGSPVEVSGGVGLYSSYNGSDVGETFHRPRVVQGWVEMSFCGRSKKLCGGVNLWGSVSTKENPSEGTEGDVIWYVSGKPNEKTNVRFEAGTYFLQHGQIHKVSAAISRDIKWTEKTTGSITSTTIYYWTTKRLGYPGGAVTKTEVEVSRDFFNGKINFSVIPAISVDNNPFALGKGKVAMIGFVEATVTIPLGKKISFFLTGTVSNPIAGDTDRGFRKFGGFGLNFN